MDGSADLTLANLRGDVVTTVPIAATAASGDVAAGVDGWSDFTEYGAPRAGSTTATTGGSVGYGWLGAKQRSTTSETAGLTLMGDRLYNSTTGRFTSLDPEPGGNATAYSYPNDPINMFDLDGHWGWYNRHIRKHMTWKNAGRAAAVIGFGVCVFASAGACLAAGLAGAAISARGSAGRWGGRTYWRSFRRDAAYAAVGFGYGKALGGLWRATGNATLRSYRVGIGVGRRSGRLRVGWKYKARYRYRASYYVHSTKFSVLSTAYQYRHGGF